jgi:P2 family phage contractile tail tube protein
MAQKIEINRITNANIYVDGSSKLGRAEEISLPNVKFKMSEHKAIGLFGAMEFPSGVDKLEMKIKWNSFYVDVMKKSANPFQSVQLQLRANMETYDANGRSAQVPVVVFITAQYKDFPLGNFKQHDNVELESNLNVYYFKMEINGEEIAECDVLANIYKVNGVDLLSSYRQNLGI